MGAGRTETARALFGADPIDSGDIYINGKKVTIKSPQDAVKYGIDKRTAHEFFKCCHCCILSN